MGRLEPGQEHNDAEGNAAYVRRKVEEAGLTHRTEHEANIIFLTRYAHPDTIRELFNVIYVNGMNLLSDLDDDA